MNHTKKSPLPITPKLAYKLGGEIYAKLWDDEISTTEANVSSRNLSVAVKSFEKKAKTAVGLLAIEKDEAALIQHGFVFWPTHGDFVRMLGTNDAYRLHVFLDENSQPTASLQFATTPRLSKHELSRWTLVDVAGEIETIIGVAAERARLM